MSFGEHGRVLQGKAGLTRAQAARHAGGVFQGGMGASGFTAWAWV
jgi:hypothetical protein